MKKHSIPDPVVSRILNYLRVSQQLEKEDVATISSDEIARLTNTSACQVRKDLTNFGKFGRPRIGYNVAHLKCHLKEIVDGKGPCNLALVGVGNLGSALLNYLGFKNEGLSFIAAFDKDENKIGKKFGDVTVSSINELTKKVIKEKNIHIGIITTPVVGAQSVANKLTKAGILSILNFAPTLISVPKKVTLRNVDFSNELKALRFYSMNK